MDFRDFHMQEIYVDIRDDFIRDYVEIIFFRYIQGVRHLAFFEPAEDAPTVIRWEAVEDGRETPNHLKLRLPRDVARFLFDGIKKILDKEKDHKEISKARLETLHHHLEDMRALAFQSLKFNKPGEANETTT